MSVTNRRNDQQQNGGSLNTPPLLRKGFEASIAGAADEVVICRIDAIRELNLWDAIGEITADVDRGAFR